MDSMNPDDVRLLDLLRARQDGGAADPLARAAARFIWGREIAFATVIDVIDTVMRAELARRDAAVIAERKRWLDACEHETSASAWGSREAVAIHLVRQRATK
jgi:hypothetical protein